MSTKLLELAATMVAAFAQGGEVKPVLPKGRREEVLSTLQWLMDDEEALRDYFQALDAEHERQGVMHPHVEIPDEQIAQITADGFGGLSDDALAVFAMTPDRLCDKIRKVERARKWTISEVMACSADLLAGIM